MRGKTVKKLKRFVEVLISQTPEDKIDKTPAQMLEQVKTHWKTRDPNVFKFVDFVIKGDTRYSNIGLGDLV